MINLDNFDWGPTSQSYKEQMMSEIFSDKKSLYEYMFDVEEGDVNYSVKLEQLANFKIAQKNISKKFETQRNLPPLEKKQMFQQSFHEKKEEITITMNDL